MNTKDIVDTEKRTLSENIRFCLLAICVGFTIVMVVLLVFGSIFAGEAAQQGIGYCWSVFGICVVAALLQFVFFTPVVIKRLSGVLRHALFGICLFAVLAITAVVIGWFPATIPSAWISFTITYLVIFGIITAVFAFKQKRETRELNEKLATYRKGKKNKQSIEN